jgi:hypothetical protein
MVKIDNSHYASVNAPSSWDKRDVFKLCRNNQWNQVHQCVLQDPTIATTPLIMDNNISTTILHQAISSKSDTQARAAVVMAILESTPNAASIAMAMDHFQSTSFANAIPRWTLKPRND